MIVYFLHTLHILTVITKKKLSIYYSASTIQYLLSINSAFTLH